MTPEATATLIRASLARLAYHYPARAEEARRTLALGLALAELLSAGYVRRVNLTGRALLARTFDALSAMLDAAAADRKDSE